MTEALGRLRSRKECVEAIKAAVEGLKENRTGWAAAEAPCREAAREGGLAEEVWRAPLEAAEEERRLAVAEAAELAEVHAIRVDDLLPGKAEASPEQTDNKPVEPAAVGPEHGYRGLRIGYAQPSAGSELLRGVGLLKSEARPKAEPEVQAKQLVKSLSTATPLSLPIMTPSRCAMAEPRPAARSPT
jgi:hypothetical protein